MRQMLVNGLGQASDQVGQVVFDFQQPPLDQRPPRAAGTLADEPGVEASQTLPQGRMIADPASAPSTHRAVSATPPLTVARSGHASSPACGLALLVGRSGRRPASIGPVGYRVGVRRRLLSF